MKTQLLVLALASTLLGATCDEDQDPPTSEVTAVPLELDAPAPPVLRRLTRHQYANTIHDLFGNDIVVPNALEPDASAHGLLAVGASVAALSPLGVERYGDAARLVAEQVVAQQDVLKVLLLCEPTSADDASCLGDIAGDVGRALWRRPLTNEEVTQVALVGADAWKELGALEDAVQYMLTRLLQSPHFLYRVEVGEVIDGDRVFSSLEMASRLSFLFWDAGPDQELLDAGESGDLLTEAGLAEQVQRLLDDPRAHRGIRNLFAEWLDLYTLDDLSKDPTIFKHYSPDLGAAAREETLLLVEHMVFNEDANVGDLLTTRTTFVNRRLAAIYNIPAPVEEGFGQVTLPTDGPRMGILGHVSFLASKAHAVSSSPTRRGVFLVERMMCRHVPAPPADVNTSIPEPSDDAVTLKDRLMVHMEEPSCAGCHAVFDPPGFGFESFDGVGRYRVLDNGGVIDPSGSLDGEPYEDMEELVTRLASHEDFERCVVETLYAYANGHAPTVGERDLITGLTERFVADDRRVLGLLEQIALSPGFRQLGEVAP